MSYVNAILEEGFDFKTAAPQNAKGFKNYLDHEYLL